MKALYLSSGIAGVMVLSLGSVLAQNDDGFSTQQNNAGWDQAEPEAVEPVEEDAVVEDVPEETGPIMQDGQPMGWQFTVVPADPESLDDPDTELTELERLSVSASGVRYGSGLYDPKSDNPLIPVAVTLRALDKITAKYTDLTIKIDESSTFGDLLITPHTCDKRPPEEFPETTAFLVIDNLVDAEVTLVEQAGENTPEVTGMEPSTSDDAQQDPDVPLMEVSVSAVDPAETTPEEIAEVTTDHYFSGWMFASSPALNALEHPVYDVWVIDCKMVDPSTLGGSE